MDIPATAPRPGLTPGEQGTAKAPAPVASAKVEATQTAQAVQAAEQAKAPELSPEQLEQMAAEMQEFVGSLNRSLQFRVDEDSGRNVVTVLDSDTGDVIRQIPSEELLDVIARLNEASGGLLNTKA
ncbi:flagellar protein FlaG [Oceanisphaera sp.]|uniref:flagellar protein FlaG n=1 Tax=Oceanisphaera sp. TaxID=1929979 RepID=UPI003A8F0DAA